MAQLIVRNLEDSVVKALRERAAGKGRSTEAEHREILRAALESPPAHVSQGPPQRNARRGDDADLPGLAPKHARFVCESAARHEHRV